MSGELHTLVPGQEIMHDCVCEVSCSAVGPVIRVMSVIRDYWRLPCKTGFTWKITSLVKLVFITTPYQLSMWHNNYV